MDRWLLRTERNLLLPVTQVMAIDYSALPSPCFILDERLLRRNLAIVREVQDRTGVTILLALKGFAMFSAFPLLRQYLSGVTASSLHEAVLGSEEFGGDVHVYCPAYRPQEIGRLLDLGSHITFNSLSQWERYRTELQASPRAISPGLRINPGYSPVTTELYNPCAPGSRLGVSATQLGEKLPDGIEGLHIHNLCESDSRALEFTLRLVERDFGRFLPALRWLNLGGGHLMTGEEYDLEHLYSLLRDFRSRYPNLRLVLEPGSAIAWRTGYLLATVLDIVPTAELPVAMLDVSIAAHMPDCLEMPYRPHIQGALEATSGLPTYKMGGLSCLAGDVVGDYSFKQPLKEGDRVVFDDMIHYTMVKTTTFNGINLPSIGIWREDDRFELIREFAYEDYRNRLS